MKITCLSVFTLYLVIFSQHVNFAQPLHLQAGINISNTPLAVSLSTNPFLSKSLALNSRNNGGIFCRIEYEGLIVNSEIRFRIGIEGSTMQVKASFRSDFPGLGSSPIYSADLDSYFFEIPLTCIYKMQILVLQPYCGAGLYLRYNAINRLITQAQYWVIPIEKNVYDDAGNFDYGLVGLVGVAHNLNEAVAFSLEGRYLFGLANLSQERSIHYSFTRDIRIGLGIRYYLGKLL